MIIYPSLKCNMRCDFCINRTFPDGGQIRDNLLNLLNLKQEIRQCPKYFKTCTIIGGEPSLLPKNYLADLIHLLKENQSKIEIISNGSNDLNHSFDFDGIDLTISYDFHFRENATKTLKNIINYKRDVYINTIISKELMNEIGIQGLIKLSRLGNVKSVVLTKLEEIEQCKLHEPTTDQMLEIIRLCRRNEKIVLDFDQEMWKTETIDEFKFKFINKMIFLLPNGKYIHLYGSKYHDTIDQCIHSLWHKYLPFIIKQKSCLLCKHLNFCIQPSQYDQCIGYETILGELIHNEIIKP